MDEVVVTGGLGFIGSHVVDACLARGDRVRIIDSQVGAVDYLTRALQGCSKDRVQSFDACPVVDRRRDQ